MQIPANDNEHAKTWWKGALMPLRIWQGWRRWCMAFILGAMATLAFPPLFILPALCIALCGFYIMSQYAKDGRSAFASSWWFGMGHFTTSLYWIANALLVDAEQFAWLIPFAVLGISGVLAIYLAWIGWMLYLFRHAPAISKWLLFALLWGIAEGLRAHLFTGFPWNLVGYVWTVSDVTIQLFAFLGVYVTGVLTVWLLSCPILCVESISKVQRTAAYTSVFLIFVGLMGSSAWRLQQATDATVPETMLRVVQAGIEQSLKWDPAHRMEGLRKHAALSVSEGYEEVTHLIWPESAMPISFTSGDHWALKLSELVPPGGLLFTGVNHKEGTFEGGDFKIYNSLKAVSDSGEVVGMYHKVHLVPFGEYIPLRALVPFKKITEGSIDFSPGIVQKPHKMGDKLPNYWPLICYEAIFPELSEDASPAWLLNITNDGWFGNTSGPQQHFQMSRVRAVERGVPLIRAANTGVSAVVDAYGRIKAYLPFGYIGTIDIPLPVALQEITFYQQYGKWLEMIFASFTVILIWFAYRYNR